MAWTEFETAAPTPYAALFGGVAWLILACRAGFDCARDADWFRNDVCLDPASACIPGESAIEHHWFGLRESERETAWQLAARMERSIASGTAGGLPWPDLAKRNIYDGRLDRPQG